MSKTTDTKTTPAAVPDPTPDDEQLSLTDGMPGEPADSIEPTGPEPTPPPKRGRGRPRGSTSSTSSTGTDTGTRRGPGRKTAQETRAEKVAGLYETMGGVLIFAAPFAPQAGTVGQAMIANSAKLGAAWAQWAATSPRVAKLIDGMSMGGGAVAVLIAHVPIALALVQPATDTDDGDGDVFGGLAGLANIMLAGAAPQ